MHDIMMDQQVNDMLLLGQAEASPTQVMSIEIKFPPVYHRVDGPDTSIYVVHHKKLKKSERIMFQAFYSSYL